MEAEGATAARLPDPGAWPVVAPASTSDLAALAGQVAPVAPASELVLPVAGELGAVLPRGGVRRGTVVSVEGAPGSGATSVALGLVAAATAAGEWAAWVGRGCVGAEAAAGAGVVLERLALVREVPRARWGQVVAALVEGTALVVVEPGSRVGAAVARRLEARVRALTADARAAGVRRGLRRREAEVRCPEAAFLPADPGAEARTFEAVARVLEDVTPRVAVERPGLLTFPARGPARYFGGDAAVAEQVLRVCAAGTTPVAVGVAGSGFAAVLAAREASPVAVVPDGETVAFLARHPVGVLAGVGVADLADRSVLQWDKDDCAAAGLVKFDLLGLGMLTAIHLTVDLVREHRGGGGRPGHAAPGGRRLRHALPLPRLPLNVPVLDTGLRAMRRDSVSRTGT